MAIFDRQYMKDMRAILDKASVLKVEPKQSIEPVKAHPPVNYAAMLVNSTDHAYDIEPVMVQPPKPMSWPKTLTERERQHNLEIAAAYANLEYMRKSLAAERYSLAAPWQTGSDGYSIGD